MKLRKILLIALALSSMFITINASALEGSGSSTTTKTLADLTDAEFKKIVPESFDVSFTKSAYISAVYDTYINDNNESLKALKNDTSITGLKAKIIDLLKQNGYSADNVTVGNETYSLNVELLPFDVPAVYVYILVETKDANGHIADQQHELYVKMNYAKESNYNEQDAAYVKKAVDGIKLTTYNGRYVAFSTYSSLDDLVKVDASEEELANQKLPYNNFSELLDDKSITVKPTVYWGDIDGLEDSEIYVTNYLSYYDISLNFYKNDVLYETKVVRVGSMLGVTLDNGTAVNIAPIEEDDKTYTEMVAKLKKDGFNNTIGAYELEAYGPTTKGMKFTLDVDKKYNDKNVIILHKKKDNTYETLKGTVKDGKVTITVDELSPFVIALDDKTTGKTVTKVSDEKSNNAQTSSFSVIPYIAIAIGSLLLLVGLIIKWKRKVA